MRALRLRLIQDARNLRMSVSECEQVGKELPVGFVPHGDEPGPSLESSLCVLTHFPPGFPEIS